jgi:hypothetical protein
VQIAFPLIFETVLPPSQGFHPLPDGGDLNPKMKAAVKIK